MENIETKIDHTYRIFKWPADKGHQMEGEKWEYVAEGIAVESVTGVYHRPWMTTNIDHLAEELIDIHLKYLKNKGRCPTDIHGSYLSFSYTPPYESAISSGKIQHPQSLTSDEIMQFEESVVRHHNKDWEDLSE